MSPDGGQLKLDVSYLDFANEFCEILVYSLCKIILNFFSGNERPAQLQKAHLRSIPTSECNTTFLEHNQEAKLTAFTNGINEGQLCAIDPTVMTKRADSCTGDSGGPLQMFASDSKFATVVGVVSFGIGCGSRLPGVYTRVAHYVKWIESHVWQDL